MSSEEPVGEGTRILSSHPPATEYHKHYGAELASQMPEFAVPEEKDSDLPRLTPRDSGDARGPGDKSSLAFTSFNYINSIVGSGCLGMPLAIHQSGVVMGLVVLICVAVLSDIGLILMIKAGRIADASNYQDLVRKAFGKPMFIFQSLIQFLYPFIALISYNIIVGDTLTKVLIRITGISPASVVVQREFLILAITLLITLPLSLYRNIAHLAKVSMVSVLLIVGVSISMEFRLYTLWDVVPTTEDAWQAVSPRFATSIGIMSFAFMCHHSSFMVYESLYDNTVERWGRTTHISVGISTLLALAYGYVGYFSFTGKVQGDIFENYCWNDDLMNICRGLYAITILLTYPIECFVAREVIENAFFDQSLGRPVLRHAVITVLIAIVGMGISLTTDCLGAVLIVNGLFCAIPLAYILPAICFIKLEEGSMWARSKWIAWGITAFGVLSMIAGVATLFLSSEDILSDCSHGKQMPYCLKNNTTHPLLSF